MELKNRFDVAWGTVDYHVENLVLTEAVKTHQAHPYLHLFDSEVPREVLAVIAALRRPNAEPILQAMDEPMQICDLQPELGLSRTIIGDHLMRFHDTGLVQKIGQHRPQYTRNDRLWSRAKSILRR